MDGTPFRDLVAGIGAMLPTRRGREAADEQRLRAARGLAAATMALVPPAPTTPFHVPDSVEFRAKLNAFTSNARYLLGMYEAHVNFEERTIEPDVVDAARASGYEFGRDLASVSDRTVRDQLRALRRVETAFIERPGFSSRYWRVAHVEPVGAPDDVQIVALDDFRRLAWSELPDDGLDSTYRWFLEVDHLGKQPEAKAFVVRQMLPLLEVAIGLRTKSRGDPTRTLDHARTAAKKSGDRREKYRPRFATFDDALEAAAVYDLLNATFPRNLRSPPGGPA